VNTTGITSKITMTLSLTKSNKDFDFVVWAIKTPCLFYNCSVKVRYVKETHTLFLQHLAQIICYKKSCQHLLTIENTDSDLKLNVLHYANELLVRLRLSFCKLAKRAATIRNYQKLGWIQCSDEGLTLEPSAVKYLYFGQFILQLIKPYYLLGQNWLWL